MKLSITKIAERGDLANERVLIRVDSGTDLSSFLLATSRYVEQESIEARARNGYWFGSVDVDAGDLVVVYTKEGRESRRPGKAGGTVRFFYRGLTKAQYSDASSCAVLFELQDWQASKRGA
jgi:hypothetical protein